MSRARWAIGREPGEAHYWEPLEDMDAAAMEFGLWMWGSDYAAQTKSAVEWWAEQSDYRKRTAADAARQIVRCAMRQRS